MEFITQDLSPQRAQLLARLAAERAHLLLQLEGLDNETLSGRKAIGEWTAAGVLAHLAYWEAVAADRLFKVADSRTADIQPLSGDDSLESRNNAMTLQFAGLPFDEAVAISQKERRNFLTALNRLSDDELIRRVRPRPGWRVTPNTWANWPHRHDAEHASEIAGWRATQPTPDPVLRVIHPALLRPILALSRREFLALASLVPAGERENRILEGSWTLKQMIGHLVDYESLGVVALKAVAAGREPTYKTVIPDFDEFNNERSAPWAETTWNEVWAHYLATRRALLLIADTLSAGALAQPFTAPWLSITTVCGYLLDMAQHEQEHADSLRRAFDLPPLPRRLGREG